MTGMTAKATGRCPRGIALALTLVLAGTAAADEVLVRVQQGTDLGAAPFGDGRLILDFAGRLWTLPMTGGTATPLSASGEYARRPAPGPDGRMLAYETLRDDGHQLMLMDADGSNARALTAAPGHSFAPAWSPDGQRLAFASDRGGEFDIWELEPATGALRQLSFEPGDELDPAWRPDGTAIAYVQVRAGRSALVLRAPGGPPRTLTESPNALRTPAWRPDGTVISYVADGPDGPRLRLAILAEPTVFKPAGGTGNVIAARATWLDREHLLYTADGQVRQREIGAFAGTEIPFEATLVTQRAPNPPERHLPAAGGARPARGLAGFAVLPDEHIVASALGDLWEFDAAGQLQRQLTIDAWVDREPDASADGRLLAFTSDRDGTPQVWVMDLATRDLVRITADAEGAARPALDAAGSRIAFLTGNNGSGRSLKVTRLDTGASITIAAGLDPRGAPIWSADGQTVGVVQTVAGQPQWLLAPADGSGSVRRLTLPLAAVGDGAVSAAWTTDGSTLLVASTAGIGVLPALGPGLPGAGWRQIAAQPARRARWLRDGSVLFTDGEGLARVAPDGSVSRVPLAIDWHPAAARGRTIVRASRIFDGVGNGYLADHEVVVEGSRIVAVQPWSTADTEARVIDAGGRTVIPGLIDLGMRIGERGGERLGRLLLAFGVTTAQVVAGDTGLREVAERWQARAAGPRLLASPGWCGETDAPAFDDADLPTGAVRLCPAATGRLPALVAPLQATAAVIWSDSWLAASTGLVHAIGPAALALPSRAAAGHGTDHYQQDAVEVMARAGVVFVPSLAAGSMAVIVRQYPDLLASRQYQALFRADERAGHERSWQPAPGSNPLAARTALRLRQRTLGRLLASGGRLATASSAPAVPYGLGLQAEIRALAGLGLSPAEALRMATAEAARAVGLHAEIGRLAPGYLADLLVIDGDPLADLSHLLRIDAVMIDGTLRPLDELVSAADSVSGQFTSTAVEEPAKHRFRPR